MSRVVVDVNLVLTCDQCGKKIRNHYPISCMDTNILLEVENLADKNGCLYENLDCSDGSLICEECQIGEIN